MPSRPLISPSLLSADFARLGEEVRAMVAAGADWLHLDVMDGRFVPNITIGADVIRALKAHAPDTPFDVHLMIAPADPHLEAFRAAGADVISVHPEAGPHLHRTLQTIRRLGAKAGVVLNPGTPLEAVEWVLDEADLLLVMSVNPGFGGQTFINAQLRKIERLRTLIEGRGLDIRLEVDGGVTPEIARLCVAAGADVLVAGSAAFRGGAPAYAANLAALRGD